MPAKRIGNRRKLERRKPTTDSYGLIWDYAKKQFVPIFWRKETGQITTTTRVAQRRTGPVERRVGTMDRRSSIDQRSKQTGEALLKQWFLTSAEEKQLKEPWPIGGSSAKTRGELVDGHIERRKLKIRRASEKKATKKQAPPAKGRRAYDKN